MDKFVIRLALTASTSAERSNNETKDQPAKKLKRSEEEGEDFQANEPI